MTTSPTTPLTDVDVAIGLRSYLLNGDNILPDPTSISALTIPQPPSFEVVLGGKRFRIDVTATESD